MGSIVYEEFTLKIEAENNRYKVSVSSGCGGDATGYFTPDELKIDLETSEDRQEVTERHAKAAVESGAGNLSLINTRPPSLIKARAFGEQLFQAVFKDKVGKALDRCMIKTRENSTLQLRIRLDLTKVPELAGLPWEFLRAVPQNNFLARSYDSIVRYLQLEIPYNDSLLKEPPLRILVVLSNPEGVTRLDVEGELKKLQDAINQLDSRQQVVLDPLYKPTIKALRKRLREHRQSAPYHVFHFIGHGVFDATGKEGKLLLENETGGAIRISAEELGEILATHRSIRLAVINACEGARTSASDSYSGVAQTLLRSGAAPVVIAMQYVIGDDAAKIFAQYFYEALLKGEDLDTAVSLARMSISDEEKNKGYGDKEPIEWGTPVLYMRASDSRLVDFPAPAPLDPDVVEIQSPAINDTHDSLEAHYKEVVKAIGDGQLVPFLGLNVNLFDQKATVRPPAYEELVERLAKFSKYPYNPGAPLAGVSQYAQLPHNLADLYDHLAPLFKQAHYKPTPLHDFLARVAKAHTEYPDNIDPRRRRFLVVTTNYDDLLEQAFIKIVKKFYVFSYIADGSDQERGKFFRKLYQEPTVEQTGQTTILVDVFNKELTDELPVILKLPGTIEEFNSKVRFAITEDQYFDLLTNRELTSILPSQVMAKLRGSHHLFLGYNLRDWNMRGLLYRIWEKQTPPYDSWAVQEGLSEFERKYWEACQVKIIDENLADYVAQLDKRLP